MSLDGDVTDAKMLLWHQRLWKAARVLVGSFPRKQLELFFFFFFFWVAGELSTLRQLMKVPNEPKAYSKNLLDVVIALCPVIVIMALTVCNASCLAKWPWCDVDDDGGEAWCDAEDNARFASGPEVSEGCVGWPV